MPSDVKLRKRHGLALGLLLLLVGGGAAKHWQTSTRDAPHASAASSSGATGSGAARIGLRDAGTTRQRPIDGVRVEGMVIDDEHDDPVPGADVRLDDEIAATTELDGSFVLDAVAPGQHTLVAQNDDLIAGPIEVRVETLIEPVILHAHAAPTLVVHVVDANGPFAGAAVEVSGRHELTDATGTVHVRGMLASDSLTVSAPKHATAWFNVDTTGDPHAVLERTISLTAGASLDGTIVGPDGAPLPDAGIVVYVDGQNHAFQLRSDDHGAWHVDELAAGRASVWTAADQDLDNVVKVEVDPAAPVHGVVLHVRQGGELAGTVADAAGASIANARVIAWVSNAPVSYDMKTDANGHFAQSGMTPGAYHVTAFTHDAGAPLVDVAIDRGGRATAALVVQPSQIAGTVVDEHGVPVPEARISISGEHEWPSWQDDPHTLTDGHGRFALPGLVPGTYTVRACPPVEQCDQATDEKVATGTRDVVLTLPSLATVRGRVVFRGAPAAQVAVSVGNAFAITTASDGRFELAGVATGDITVELSAPHALHLAHPTHVDPGGTLDLGDIELAPATRLHGRVTFPDGTPVAGAVVAGGDGDLQRISQPLHEAFSGFVAITDANGDYAVDEVGNNQVSVRATLGRTQSTHSVEVPPGDDPVLDLTMLRTGTLIVHIRGHLTGFSVEGGSDGLTSYGFGDPPPEHIEVTDHATDYEIVGSTADSSELPGVPVTILPDQTVEVTIGP